MRDRIFAIKSGAIEPAAPVQDAASAYAAASVQDTAPIQGTAPVVQTVYRMPLKNLIFTGLSNSKALIIMLIILGGVSQFADIFFRSITYDSVYVFLSKLAVPVLVLLFALFIIVSWFISVVGVLITNFGFTIRNAGSKIEIERGLLDHKTISIEKDRIQEVRVSQGLIRRMIGYAEISVTTATLKAYSSGGQKSNNEILGLTVIHPFIAIREVDFFLGKLLPDFDRRPKTFDALPQRAKTRSVRRYVLWTLVVELVCWLTVSAIYAGVMNLPFSGFMAAHTGLILLLSVPLLIFMGVSGYFNYRGRGVAINDRFLSIRTGTWGRRYSFIPRRKIQTARLSKNPFQAFAGLATLAGTTGAHGFPSLRDIDLERGAYYLDWSIQMKHSDG
jgi:putative membrane protein